MIAWCWWRPKIALSVWRGGEKRKETRSPGSPDLPDLCKCLWILVFNIQMFSTNVGQSLLPPPLSLSLSSKNEISYFRPLTIAIAANEIIFIQ